MDRNCRFKKGSNNYKLVINGLSKFEIYIAEKY